MRRREHRGRAPWSGQHFEAVKRRPSVAPGTKLVDAAPKLTGCIRAMGPSMSAPWQPARDRYAIGMRGSHDFDCTEVWIAQHATRRPCRAPTMAVESHLDLT